MGRLCRRWIPPDGRRSTTSSLSMHDHNAALMIAMIEQGLESREDSLYEKQRLEVRRQRDQWQMAVAGRRDSSVPSWAPGHGRQRTPGRPLPKRSSLDLRRRAKAFQKRRCVGVCGRIAPDRERPAASSASREQSRPFRRMHCLHATATSLIDSHGTEPPAGRIQRGSYQGACPTHCHSLSVSSESNRV